MDTYLAVASKRDTRRYASRPIPADVVDRILDAGRLAGSARNRQPWRFVVIEDEDVRGRIAETVYEPQPATINLSGIPVAFPTGSFLQATEA